MPKYLSVAEEAELREQSLVKEHRAILTELYKAGLLNLSGTKKQKKDREKKVLLKLTR